MTDEQIYAVGMIVKTMVEALGMQAENMNRFNKGQTIAYLEDAFIKLEESNGCTHNGLMTMLHPERVKY